MCPVGYRRRRYRARKSAELHGTGERRASVTSSCARRRKRKSGLVESKASDSSHTSSRAANRRGERWLALAPARSLSVRRISCARMTTVKICIDVADLDEAGAFYCQALQCTEV